MPSLNEEKDILSALEDTLSAFKEFGIDGEVLVINDGSTDSTPMLVQGKIKENPHKIRMIEHPSPKGIGASFWDGVEEGRGNIVCMLPGDNENEPGQILRYINLLENVDMVIPFVFNRTIRSRLRNLLSSIYKLIINNTFLISLNYTNGTVLYRKSLLKELKNRDSSFFFQTDILIRLVKRRYLFAEVPYRLRTRKAGKSKAITLRAFVEVVKGYLRLVKDVYFKKEITTGKFTSDSVSVMQYKG